MTEKQRVRSPRYPAIPLAAAEKMAEAIFRGDGMNAVDRESAVRHIGYASLNGASATALASLKQYGLTVDAGKGMLRLTDLALDLIEPETADARHNALRVAAFTPDLFSALRERFPEKVPSESNLRAHLLRQNFTAAAVKAIVPAYLETCGYIASWGEYESHRNGDGSDIESSETSVEEARSMPEPSQAFPTHAPVRAPVTPSSGRRMVFDTEEGEAVFTYPDNLSEESVSDLEEWFALVIKRLKRATRN